MMTGKKKIVAAGHICLDITPIFPGETEGSIAEVLTPGRLIHMNGVDVHIGGSAANTGLALKKMGADVRILGKIGQDTFGELARSSLKKYQAEDGLIWENGGRTSYSVILAVPGTDRIFLHDPGANDSYCAEDIPEKELEGAGLFHFGYPPLMRKMYQGKGEELKKILQRAKTHGIPVSLDMAAVDADSPAGNADWEGILKNVLPLVDIFLPSIEELLFMADREIYEKIIRLAAGRDVTEVVDIEKDVAGVAKKMLDWGARIVLVKCGRRGLYLTCAGRKQLLESASLMGLTTAGWNVQEWAGKTFFEASYKPRQVCSGTGAGDTCIAAFLLSMLQGKGPEQCVRLAAAQGACCVEAYDAFEGLHTLEELENRIEQGWEKNKIES